MSKVLLRACVLGLLSMAPVAYAYELATHGALTWHAYQRSVLVSDPTQLRNLGIDTTNVNPFGGVYYDISGARIQERSENVFERVIIEVDLVKSIGANAVSIPGWLMRGAIREDDLGFVFKFRAGLDPHDDPYGPFWRVMHHFYDPARNLPLTLSQNCAILFQQATGESAIFRRAPDWAVGSSDAFIQPNTPEANRRNHFTIFDAREAMYRALTGRDSQGNPLQPASAPAGTLTKQSDIRSAYWATTFRALGDVLHLNQDMAQPQHTRNDTHGGAPCFGHESTFEKYIEARATGVRSFSIDGAPVTPQLLDYGSYPIPAFTKYSDFWSTREGLSGRGLADYSNRGFFTFGTNLGSNPYTSPSNDTASYTTETDPQQLRTYLRGDVPDTLNTGFTKNIRMTTESAFDEFLAPVPPTYSLNRFNYDDMANLLIPRAVAYSAGLINYFFRGKLDGVAQGPGTLLVTNLSAEGMEGDFDLYYDDAQGNRHPVTVTACRVGAVDVPVDQGKCKGAALASVNSDPIARLTLTFDAPAGPAPRTPGEYMLVFNGKLGEEAPDAGAVGAVVGKLVSNPYNGVLYLAGEDSSRVVRYFKVDQSGVSFVQPGQLNPLSGITGFRERAYHFKQAVVTATTSGAPVHKTVGLAIRGQFGDMSLIPNPAAAGALRTVSGISWSAQTSDPAVGSFEFRLVILDGTGRSARLDYTRRFTNAQGQPAQVEGVLRLPDLPLNAAFTYANFSTGFLLVSGDGTTIYPRGSTDARKHGVRITLSAVPTAALFDLPQQTSTSAGRPGFINVTQVGECSVNYLATDFSGSPPFPASITAPLRREERLVADGESASSSTQIEDFMHGSLLSYEIRTQGRLLDRTVKETCIAAATDWSGPSAQVKVNIRHVEQSERINRFAVSYLVPNGTLQHVTDSSGALQASAVTFGCGLRAELAGPAPSVNGPSIVGAGGFFHDVKYSYEGFGPCPAQPATIRVPAETGTPKHRLYRALTDRSTDAVYTEEENNLSVLKFRTERIPNGVFLADASPIGEVFIATPDLSLLVHEPRPGNMPVLTRETIPAGIVRLLAAVWM